MQYIKFLAFIATAISVVSAGPLPVENGLKRSDALLNAREEPSVVAADTIAEGPSEDIVKPDPDCFILYPCINWKRVL
ncbi:hypothetical protein B0H13DRAFT_2653255 [Mycena leptocephala]|nr:hypothetical protein B0H13DRAFT_2653255 [Mycena leptocephala]